MDIGRLLQGVLGSDAGASLQREVARMTGGGGGKNGGGKSGGNGAGGLLGGAAAGGLLAMVLGSKKGRKMGGKALKYGGAALLAGLAYKAWSDYKANKAPQHDSVADLPPAPARSGFALEEEVDTRGSDFRLAVVRAMIAAAKSDGHVDAQEQARITAAIQDNGLSAEEKGFLIDAFTGAADPVAIAALARTEEQAAELYVASRLAIDPDEEAERRYLDRLAGALRLPDALVAHLDTKVEDARRQLADES
ncbi:tellurite resistance TerB family protein [Novispirillum sp. DQ9]|uniref:tellurite resistance TerB family protein n=1 Tax=Novispirillum sp. DQ9 TaxID=3398612 RepID=UPI003C7B094F